MFQLPASNWTQRPDLETRMCHLLTTERVAGINFCWLLHDLCGLCGVKGDFWFLVVGSIWPLPIYFWPRAYRPAIAVTRTVPRPLEKQVVTLRRWGRCCFSPQLRYQWSNHARLVNVTSLLQVFCGKHKAGLQSTSQWIEIPRWFDGICMLAAARLERGIPTLPGLVVKRWVIFSGTFYATNTDKCKRWTWSYMHV